MLLCFAPWPKHRSIAKIIPNVNSMVPIAAKVTTVTFRKLVNLALALSFSGSVSPFAFVLALLPASVAS